MPKFKKRVCVVGLGYVGLPTALLAANSGWRVTGVDVDCKVIVELSSGIKKPLETEVQLLLTKALRNQSVVFTTQPEPSDVFVICVQTPFSTKSFVADLSHVEAAIESIAPVLEKGNLIVIESTVPAGTTEELVELLSSKRPDLVFPGNGKELCDVNVAFCPERVMPGNVIHELMNNRRIIGGVTPQCGIAAKFFFQSFTEAKCDVVSDTRTAELIKLFENSFRDVNIAFANEVATLCDIYDVQCAEVIEACNYHPRVSILAPGIGVGGHCIPVDPNFIIQKSPRQARLIQMARQVNIAREDYIIKKIESIFPDSKNVICFGLSYKPNTADCRESPALRIFRRLREKYGERVSAVDPYVNTDEYSGVKNYFEEDIEKGISDLIILVNHSQLKTINLDACQILFDVREM